jgi:phosphatidyl-myo-inositol dimannoside synthase
MRILWVTNDLPPRTGGIQQFVVNLLRRVHPASSVVVGPAGGPEAATHDAGEPYRTIRLPGAVQPTPAVRRRVLAAGVALQPDVVVLGAAWPLGELAPALARHLGVPVVALSHGLEAGLARVGLGRLVARATRELTVLGTISDFTAAQLERHVRAGRVERIPPGVDLERFTPQLDGTALRAAWGIPPTAPLVGCVSRLVPRKGQDQLLAVWPALRRRHPAAWLALVGEGPREPKLRRRVDALGPDAQVVVTGRVGWESLPACFAALDVFAMPCRTRWAGLDVEGLGIVYLEAQACGVPAVAGRSGGAPETVLDGITGSVVDGRDRAALLAALDRWLADPAARDAAGLAGRRWVEQRWGWQVIAARFGELLAEVVATTRAS